MHGVAPYRHGRYTQLMSISLDNPSLSIRRSFSHIFILFFIVLSSRVGPFDFHCWLLVSVVTGPLFSWPKKPGSHYISLHRKRRSLSPVYKEKKIALRFSAKMVWKRKGEKKWHKNILREWRTFSSPFVLRRILFFYLNSYRVPEIFFLFISLLMKQRRLLCSYSKNPAMPQPNNK